MTAAEASAMRRRNFRNRLLDLPFILSFVLGLAHQQRGRRRRGAEVGVRKAAASGAPDSRRTRSRFRQKSFGTSVAMPGWPMASSPICSSLSAPWKAQTSDTAPGQ